MSPSYKDQVRELREALTESISNVSVLKTQEANARRALVLTYRATGAVWQSLSRLKEFPIDEEDTPGFLATRDLPLHNVELMSDHIMTGLQGILRGAGQVSLELEGVKNELLASNETLQLHRDGLEHYNPIDLSSPLTHLTNALDWLEKEDQSLRTQVRASQAARIATHQALLEGDTVVEDVEERIEAYEAVLVKSTGELNQLINSDPELSELKRTTAAPHVTAIMTKKKEKPQKVISKGGKRGN